MAEQITLAKAALDYFGTEKKVTTTEYRELTQQDKEELRELFIKDGLDIAPLSVPKPKEE
jgi:hypothetical protein